MKLQRCSVIDLSRWFVIGFSTGMSRWVSALCLFASLFFSSAEQAVAQQRTTSQPAVIAIVVASLPEIVVTDAVIVSVTTTSVLKAALVGLGSAMSAATKVQRNMELKH